MELDVPVYRPRRHVEAQLTHRLRPQITVVHGLRPGYAKVDELHAAVRGDEDIARLDVAVCDPMVVHVRDGAEQLIHERGRESDERRGFLNVIVISVESEVRRGVGRESWGGQHDAQVMRNIRHPEVDRAGRPFKSILKHVDDLPKIIIRNSSIAFNLS